MAQDQDVASPGVHGREEAECKVAAEAWRRGERVQEQQGAEERGAGRRPRKGEPDRGAGGEGEPAREEDQEALVQVVRCQLCVDHHDCTCTVSVNMPPSEQNGQVEHAAGEGVDVQAAPQLARDHIICLYGHRQDRLDQPEQQHRHGRHPPAHAELRRAHRAANRADGPHEVDEHAQEDLKPLAWCSLSVLPSSEAFSIACMKRP